MIELLREIFPLDRSLTGDGVRQTLDILCRDLPHTRTELATGTAVFDWTIPNEWNLHRATLRGPDGQIICDSHVNILHVVGYSTPIKATLSLEALQPHLHSLPEQPELIPYRTSYYKADWGFCLPHRVRESLPAGQYEVDIDATLQPGHLSYAEIVLPGKSTEEVLLSAHICHPSMANDNCSGLVVARAIAERLHLQHTHFTYRILFAPGTIGAIAWLAQNEQHSKANIKHGLILSGLGAGDGVTWKRTQRGDTLIDRAAEHVADNVVDFSPYGYDERQYNSPGFDLSVGLLTRAMWGSYPQYHTSADNLDFVSEMSLQDSLDKAMQIIDVLERNAIYRNTQPHGEPQLGKRGLYSALGGTSDSKDRQMAMLWVLNQSDGSRDLLSIATRAKLPFAMIADVASVLASHGLLRNEPRP